MNNFTAAIFVTLAIIATLYGFKYAPVITIFIWVYTLMKLESL